MLKGQVQLINGVNLYGKTEATKTFGNKIFNYYEFGYRRITIERPLRESFQFIENRIEELRFVSILLDESMNWIRSVLR